MYNDGNLRLKMGDDLANNTAKGMLFNNATIEISASNVGESNDKIGIRYGGNRAVSTKKSNYVLHGSDLGSPSYIFDGTFQQHTRINNNSAGIGYSGAIHGWTDVVFEEGHFSSMYYNIYAAHDVKTRFWRIHDPSYGGGYGGKVAIGSRSEVSSHAVQNASDDSWIVAVAGHAIDSGYNDYMDDGTSTTSVAIPTSHPTTVTLTMATSDDYHTLQVIRHIVGFMEQ